jgi:hypothetical protein
MSERRERMRALGIIGSEAGGGGSERGIVSNGPQDGSGSLPSIREPQTATPGGAHHDEFSRALAALLTSSQMGGMSGQEDSDEDDEPPRPVQIRQVQTMPMDMSREMNEATTSLAQARTTLASAREDNARLGSMDLTRLGGAGGTPATFVIRSNGGNGSVQIERRAALREAIDAID